MRIVYTLSDLQKAQLFSSFLNDEGIDNQLEIETNTDWGSSNYGDVTCKIWVYNEDQFPTAMRWKDEFEKNPNNPVFQNHSTKMRSFLFPPVVKRESPIGNPSLKTVKEEEMLPPEREPLGTMTLYLLILCGILFVASFLTTPNYTPFPSNIPPTPLFTAPIKKMLLFDYPQAYEIIDKLVNLYGIEKLQNPADLPSEGRYLYDQFLHTPYWQGFYDKIFHWVKDPHYKIEINAPLFEKIRQGEVWRLITPCFLHSDILHLFFNMIWLVVLGKQMEQKIGKWRYLLFCLITGVVSNIAQYLMSGPNFIGFSGILCGMIMFIWIRQKKAAWEGYQLQRATMAFVCFFVLSMVLLQAISFYLEAFQQKSFPLAIANTAHLTGAICGAILANFEYFGMKLR